MKITIESTDRLVTISDGANRCEIPARVWEGTTESGIPVSVLVTRIAASIAHNQAEFEKQLQECRPPTMHEVYPLRMIL
jgi:hypothetical protein